MGEDEKVWRIHWKSEQTKSYGQEEALLSEQDAKSRVDELNQKWRTIHHWTEKEAPDATD